MAEECGESCTAVTSSSSSVVPPTNWWDLHGPTASALTSWCNHNTTTNNTNIHNPWYRHAIPNPNSNSDEDASISTSSFTNHSGLTVESSRRVVEPAASSSDDTHIWNHVLLNVGSNGDLPSHQDIGENFLDMLSSTKNMFESDYLKKLDTSNNNSNNNNNWDHHHHQFSNSSSPPNSLSTNNFINNNNKPINFNTHDHDHHNHSHHSAMAASETERLSKLSNLISTWSIAPPESAAENPQISLRSPPPSTDHHHDRYTKSNNLVGSGNNIPGLFAPCFGQNNIPKIENGSEEIVEASEAARALLRRSFNHSSRSEIGSYHTHHQVGLTGSSSNIMVGDNIGKYHNNYGTMMINSVESYNNSTTGGDSVRNFADVISFSGRLGKPLIDDNTKLGASKSLSTLSDHSKKQYPQTRSNGRGQGNGSSSSEGKKKRSEDDNSETSLKKPKQENSTASSPKIQAPKVKLGERITALQQIVSPFGKTDTASVLYEAIQYIKFLQEQVQLLSNPYMKTNSHKDIWASFDRKVDHVTKSDHHHHQHHHHTHHHNHHHHQMMKVDLRSRGLCLVPVSCTPQVYRENAGSDYWTPTYRGCLYR